MIDQTRALTLARETGEPYETSTHEVRAVPGLDERFVRLSIVRLIGLAEREQTTSVSRDTDEEPEFRQRCARAWKELERQHKVTREETGI